jgi:hypothetical protein
VRDEGANRFFVEGLGYAYGTGSFLTGSARDGPQNFSGLIDHVRAFTFTSGEFGIEMLSPPASAIPEPATNAAHAGVLVLGLFRRRHRVESVPPEVRTVRSGERGDT